MSNSKLTSISEIGEFRLIDRLTRDIKPKNESTVFGIGDDAAVLENGSNKYTIVSKDLLVEGIHFDMTYTPLKHLGYKAAAVNFSDMAAMNGVPKQMLVGIAISSKYSVEAIEEVYRGMKKACEVYGVDFIGGDTTSSLHGLLLSVTVIGEVEKTKITYRSGAQPNDLVCVTGDLGGAYMGLLVLEREKQGFKANPDIQPDMAGKDYILQRQLKPEPRLDIVKKLEEHNIVPSAMIDVSDGLASEAIHIAKASHVGIALYEEKIPIDQNTFDTASEFKIIPTVAALNGGEDYELLFTVKQNDFEKISQIKGVSIIGYVTDFSEGNRLIANGNQVIELKAQGWDGLKK